MSVSQALAVLLIALTPIDWLAVVIVWRALRRSPEVHALRSQRDRFIVSALAATTLAAISGDFLLGHPLPRNAGFVGLVLVLVLVSGPPVLFLFDFYRRAAE